MADMLRVTTPLTGQEKTGQIRSNVPDHNTGIHNVVNPNRVSKGDGKTLYNDNQEGRFSPNLKSNFDSFLQKLAGMPSMSAETAKLFFARYGSIVSSGMNEGIAAEMSQYLEMMKVGEKELLALLKGMQGSSVKFTGSFFDVLRNVLNGPSSGDAKNLVLEFLRKYDALTGSNHTLQNIMANLNSIADRMRKSSADELRGLIGKLNSNVSKGDIQGNIAVIKEDIIPLLSKYMTQTRDFGSVRDYISLFILNLVRYESGGKEGFSEALNALLSIPEINSKISNKMVADLVDGIFSNMGADQAKMLSDQLVSILTKGLNGQAGHQNTAVFENILQSALINQSVYMPLLHMMFPADYNGSQMFSEIWVDPDSKDGNGYEGGNAVKLLVKFDIRDVGFFEMIMLIQNSKVDMQLFYPENLEGMRAQIKDNIFRIIERNDLTFRSYMAEKCEKPKAISEVFHKLYEGRNMINVVI